MVLPTDGEEFLKNLEIIDYMTFEKNLRGHFVLILQVLHRNNLVKAILGAFSYGQQEI